MATVARLLHFRLHPRRQPWRITVRNIDTGSAGVQPSGYDFRPPKKLSLDEVYFSDGL
jgi:hypothetical protein